MSERLSSYLTEYDRLLHRPTIVSACSDRGLLRAQLSTKELTQLKGLCAHAAVLLMELATSVDAALSAPSRDS